MLGPEQLQKPIRRGRGFRTAHLRGPTTERAKLLGEPLTMNLRRPQLNLAIFDWTLKVLGVPPQLHLPIFDWTIPPQLHLTIFDWTMKLFGEPLTMNLRRPQLYLRILDWSSKFLGLPLTMHLRRPGLRLDKPLVFDQTNQCLSCDCLAPVFLTILARAKHHLMQI
jgi:hypothetical protein